MDMKKYNQAEQVVRDLFVNYKSLDIPADELVGMAMSALASLGLFELSGAPAQEPFDFRRYRISAWNEVEDYGVDVVCNLCSEQVDACDEENLDWIIDQAINHHKEHHNG